MATPEFTSSGTTERSIPYRDIVDFGKKLIAVLKSGEQPDTTERWMAFHLAELIIRAEAANAQDKPALERECVDVILKLWTHRAEMRGHKRPMKDFEGVFRYLERIAQDRPAFYHQPEVELNMRAVEWLKLAEGLDHAARILIRWCVSIATAEAAKTDARWANDPVARVLGDGADTASARVLIYDAELFFAKHVDPDAETVRLQQLENVRNKLDAVVDMAAKVRAMLDRQLGAKKPKRKVAKKKAAEKKPQRRTKK